MLSINRYLGVPTVEPAFQKYGAQIRPEIRCHPKVRNAKNLAVASTDEDLATVGPNVGKSFGVVECESVLPSRPSPSSSSPSSWG